MPTGMSNGNTFHHENQTFYQYWEIYHAPLLTDKYKDVFWQIAMYLQFILFCTKQAVQEMLPFA